MDKTTRLVVVTIAVLCGVFFVVASVILFAQAGDLLLPGLYLPFGLLLLVSAYFLARRSPRV